MSLKGLFWQIAPFLAFFQEPLRGWYDVAMPPGDEHYVVARLRQRYGEAREWREFPSALRAFSDRLREEHQRLETAENKSRAVLAAASLLVAFGGFVFVPTIPLSSAGAPKGPMQLIALLGIIYLGSAVLAALSAGKIGVRWYVDPTDLVEAQRKLGEDTRTDALVAAVMMTYKDQMAVGTNLKLRALEIANLSLRNGLLVIVFDVATQVFLPLFR